MSDFIIVLAIIFIMFISGMTIGTLDERDIYQQRCVVKYGDMPSNKVQDYCKELLKFNKESN